MLLIVGLGNPGPEYEKTPHNTGYMVLDRLAKRYGLDWQPKFAGFLALSQHLLPGGEISRTALFKPQLFMNRSGKAVLETARFYKIKPADIWSVHDELDLPLGGLKITFNKSSAGHKGVESLIHELKTQAFFRVRLGVMPPQKPANPDEYLTNRPLSVTHLKYLVSALERAEEALDQIARGESAEKVLSWANKNPVQERGK